MKAPTRILSANKGFADKIVKPKTSSLSLSNAVVPWGAGKVPKVLKAVGKASESTVKKVGGVWKKVTGKDKPSNKGKNKNTPKTVEDILKDAKLGKRTKGRTTQYDKKRGGIIKL